ncbi:MAG TPA: glycosyltransferase family 2 protein [Candidatus Gallacutalibacter stercoravium]|nr:glycosyltransferase family 2 protein [Candidatus Gallacutalibacter stercoravium]
MKVLIIIPAYNEEKCIEQVVRAIDGKYPNVDYLVVNDCSRDNTEKILRQNGFSHLKLPINLGIGGGVQSGYLYAVENNYDITIQMDGDGQHDPSYIPALIEPICSGQADMVIGSRFIEKRGFQSSALRRLGIHWLKHVIRLCSGVKISDATSGFRACSKSVTRLFSESYAQDYPEPEAIVAAAMNGFRVCEVPVQMNERLGGDSSISGLKSIYYMIKVTLALLICRLGGKGGK